MPGASANGRLASRPIAAEPIGGGDAGGDEGRAVVDPGAGENQRIDHDDVGHRQEGGAAGQYLGADRRAVCAEVEHVCSAQPPGAPCVFTYSA